MKVNEDDKTIEQFNDYPTDEFTGTQGNVQMLNEEANQVLVGWGSRENNDSLFTEENLETDETLLEFQPNDKEVISYWSFKFSE